MSQASEFDWSHYGPSNLVVANFVMSSQGEWADENGSSRGISNQLDRNVLIHLRRNFSAVLTGGNTARTEGYRKSDRFKTYVVTRPGSLTPAGLERIEPRDLLSLKANIELISKKHLGLLVEAGPTLLRTLAGLQLIDRIYLTVIGSICSPSHDLTASLGVQGFAETSRQVVEDTTFLVLNRVTTE